MHLILKNFPVIWKRKETEVMFVTILTTIQFNVTVKEQTFVQFNVSITAQKLLFHL